MHSQPDVMARASVKLGVIDGTPATRQIDLSNAGNATTIAKKSIAAALARKRPSTWNGLRSRFCSNVLLAKPVGPVAHPVRGVVFFERRGASDSELLVAPQSTGQILAYDKRQCEFSNQLKRALGPSRINMEGDSCLASNIYSY